jgi:hypothetical protein
LDENKIKKKDHSMRGAGKKHCAPMYPFFYPKVEAKNIFQKIFRKIWIDYLYLVDPFCGWIIPAIIKGFKVIKDNRISIIISTGPPFSAMLVGYFLNIMTNTKLILDYRDPWSNRKRKHIRILNKKLNAFLEKKVIRRASALVFCSKIMMEDFKNYLGRHTNATYHIITNGFENRIEIEPRSANNGKLNIVYAGNFYGERSIEIIVNPLLNLINKGIIKNDGFELNIFGELGSKDIQIIKKFGLHKIINQHSWLPYDQIIKYLKGADILLLISGSDVRYAIPFKFFDYLSVKRPIFAIAPINSAIVELIREIDCGHFASIDNQYSIQESLESMLLEPREYSFYGMDKYSWDVIAKKYLRLIGSL